MSTFTKVILVVSALLITSQAGPSDIICVWGSTLQPKINGVYRWSGYDENNNQDYAKTADIDYIKSNRGNLQFDPNNTCTDPIWIKRNMYNSQLIASEAQTYAIAGTRNSNFWDSYNWRIYNGSEFITNTDVDLFLVNSDAEDGCPNYQNCVGFQVTSSVNDSCNGVFYEVDGVSNAYKKHEEDYWIYWAKFEGLWVCNDKLEPDSCLSDYLATSEDSGPLAPAYGDYIDLGTLGLFECLGTIQSVFYFHVHPL